MTEEENIEYQPKDDSTQQTGNNDTISEPRTINEQPSTENMELHKHPHHVTHKKKWGRIFLSS